MEDQPDDPNIEPLANAVVDGLCSQESTEKLDPLPEPAVVDLPPPDLLSSTDAGLVRLLARLSHTTYVEYICTNSRCKGDRGQYPAKDYLKLEPDEHPVGTMNCWSCKAGLGIKIEAMLQGKVGMFPIVYGSNDSRGPIGTVPRLTMDEHTEIREKLIEDERNRVLAKNVVTPVVPREIGNRPALNPATRAAQLAGKGKKK